MPWKPIYKNKREIKTERTLLLLLGGSIYDDSNGGIRIDNRRRRNDERFRTPEDVHLEEHLWQRDFHAITDFFKQMNVEIWRCIPTRLRSDRREAMGTIIEFFAVDTAEENHDRKTFLIYWCGHGTTDTGDWGFTNGGEITCRHILDAWQNRPAIRDGHRDNSFLTIIADTCYAGGWINELQRENLPNVVYQAASRADECAYAVNDGLIPRSLLMRRFFFEANYPNLGWYVWTCVDQHPQYWCSYAEEEQGEGLAQGQRRTIVRRGNLSLFAVDRHWSVNGKMTTKELKKQLNQLAKCGTFIDNQ